MLIDRQMDRKRQDTCPSAKKRTDQHPVLKEFMAVGLGVAHKQGSPDLGEGVSAVEWPGESLLPLQQLLHPECQVSAQLACPSLLWMEWGLSYMLWDVR